jgi:putative MATE family efflux protein
MRDLTQGSITRHLLETAGFMLVAMVFQSLYFLIDLYWVGHLGKEAVAAVAIAGNLTFLVLAVSQMLGVGTTTLMAHAVGRKDHDRALVVLHQSQVLSIVVGVVFLATALALRGPYARTLGADAQTVDLALAYLLWFIPAMALQFGMVAMSAALRGSGNFKPGMVVQTVSVILNMVLAPFLIFGWGTGRPLGVAGAAIASLVAVVVGTVWLGSYFVRGDAYLHFTRGRFRPDTALWGQLLRIGLPAGAEFALMAAYLFLVYTITRPFGSEAQAGFGIGLRIIQAGFIPVVALGFAVAPVAGQNFGARHGDRVRRTFTVAATLAVAVMALWGLVCFFAAVPMLSVFSSDAHVVLVGDDYLHVLSFTFVASGLIFVSSSMFQALGNTIPPLGASFGRIVITAIPAVVLSRTPGFQLRWLWYLSAGTVLVQLTAVLLLLRRELRLRLT